MQTVIRRVSVVGAVVSVVLSLGCDRSDSLGPLTAPATQSASSASHGWSPDSADMQLLARGLALALRSSAVRQQIMEDMRDSPFEGNGIAISSYLRGRRGRPILDSAARLLAVPIGQLEGALGPPTENGLEFGMPRYSDRHHWTPDAPILVVGVHEQLQVLVQRHASGIGDVVRSYDNAGVARTVDVGERGNTPYLLLSQPAHAFGRDPETRRALAPKRTGSTIGAAETRAGMLIPYCDPAVDPSCDGGGGAADPGYLVLPSGQSYANCVSYVLVTPLHADCRAELAWAFRPRQIFNDDEPCPARAPFWAAQAEGTGGVSLYYALSYRQDCGNRSGTADSHFGDSEFIIVRVEEQTVGSGRWRVYNVTLSAHYKGPWWTDATWTGDPPAIEFRPGEYRTRPKVYASWGKHGNYRDTGSCGSSAYGLDDCGRAVDVGAEPGFSQGSSQDLGSRNERVNDCVYSYAFASSGPECYWSYSPASNFSGWLNVANYGSTAYTVLLADFGF